MKNSLTLCVLSLALVAAAPAPSAYVQSIEKWRSAEAADLQKDNGWLTLTGLYWLKEGSNSIGVGPAFDVRLTDNFKSGKFGEIDFHQGVAKLRVANGVEAMVEGKPVSTVILTSDAQGKPTEVHTGSQTFYLIQREDRFAIRLKDSQSKARLTFQGQHWFPVDESYKVTAHLEAFPAPKELLVPNKIGGHFKMKSPGLLKFVLQGKKCSLQPVVENDGSLFLIFRDQSNDHETYSAGRFLNAPKPVNGEAVLDFNQAENPPCAFTPFATCPLPPPGNDLAVAVAAGEKRYK